MKKKVALITGITGQDGSYLSELLVSLDYEVHGVSRNCDEFHPPTLDKDELCLHDGDIRDRSFVNGLIEAVRPDELYNLAAQSSVGYSFAEPALTSEVNAMGCLHLLEATHVYSAATRFYQASSSELYGDSPAAVKNEETPFKPISPYAFSKAMAHFATVNYRQCYGAFACNGILFNHESPRRPEAYVTRKITKAAARIRLGLQDKLLIGNLDIVRDWGHAKDYMEAAWKMMQQPAPDDYVIATGRPHSLREFVEIAFGKVDLSWQEYVVQDPEFHRPAEISRMAGDYSKAKDRLGWEPRTTLEELIEEMLQHDLAQVKSEASIPPERRSPDE